MGVPISVPTLQTMALKLNEKLNGDFSFTASVGWLSSRWKGSHGIRELQIRVSGKILSRDTIAINEFRIKFQKFASDENLKPTQIFNADETGLNYKMLSEKD